MPIKSTAQFGVVQSPQDAFITSTTVFVVPQAVGTVTVYVPMVLVLGIMAPVFESRVNPVGVEEYVPATGPFVTVIG